jgi:hypothetical protein
MCLHFLGHALYLLWWVFILVYVYIQGLHQCIGSSLWPEPTNYFKHFHNKQTLQTFSRHFLRVVVAGTNSIEIQKICIRRKGQQAEERLLFFYKERITNRCTSAIILHAKKKRRVNHLMEQSIDKAKSPRQRSSTLNVTWNLILKLETENHQLKLFMAWWIRFAADFVQLCSMSVSTPRP